MAGVKGRSGRKSLSDEAKRLKIIERAWDLVGERLNSDHTDRYLYAKDIVLKDITQKVHGEGFDNGTKIIIVRPSKKVNENTTQTVSR